MEGNIYQDFRDFRDFRIDLPDFQRFIDASRSKLYLDLSDWEDFED